MALLWSARRLALNFLSVEISSGSVPFSIYNTLLKHFVFLFLSFSLHIENSKNKKISFPSDFFCNAIDIFPLQTNFHHPKSYIQKKMININKSIDCSYTCLHVHFWFLYAFIFYLKDKRVKIKNFFFRFICSLHIQYLSIYFTSILKRAFDVYCPLPVILAYKFSWIWDWIS